MRRYMFGWVGQQRNATFYSYRPVKKDGTAIRSSRLSKAALLDIRVVCCVSRTNKTDADDPLRKKGYYYSFNYGGTPWFGPVRTLQKAKDLAMFLVRELADGESEKPEQ